MYNYANFRNQIIIILFSLSFILSFVIFPNFTVDKKILFILTDNFGSRGLEFRFLYLFTFFFLIYDSININKINKNIIICAAVIPFSIILYSVWIIIYKFGNDHIFFHLSQNEMLLKLIYQFIVIGLSILIVGYYKNFLINNITKIVDFSVCIFVILIIFFEIFHSGILFDTLFKCDLGFFYNTKFLFKESSHFSAIAIPIIVFFIYNIKNYKNNFFILVVYLIFLVFCFGIFNLTFFVSIISSIIIIFIISKNIENISKCLFLILMTISCILFFIDKTKISLYQNCISNTISIVEKHSLKIDKERDFFKGKVESEKKKILSIFKKNNHNLSTSIYVYSLYVAKKSLSENIFGVGLNNYKIYRNKLDSSLKIEFEEKLSSQHNHNYKIIKFKEKYMPNLRALILNFNKNTGSNNFSKMITEFGFFGILILFLIFIFSFSREIDENIKVFFIPLIFIQTFIRGTGYFNSGFLISLIIVLLIILSLLIKKYENYKISNR